jgi:hypothetical protein
MNRRARVILLLGGIAAVAAALLWFGRVSYDGISCGTAGSPRTFGIAPDEQFVQGRCDDAIGSRRETAIPVAILAVALLASGVSQARATGVPERPGDRER